MPSRTPYAFGRSGPPLRSIRGLFDGAKASEYPFNLPAFADGIDLELQSNVTFFVGENGSGKSTLLEAVAEVCGFNPQGGNRDHHYATFADRSVLAQALRLGWAGRKLTDGFFLRAESFFNFATYMDDLSIRRPYGGKSLHQQSHGESFMSLFMNRFEHGIYILDEPEAALSPQRQLSLLTVIHDLEVPGHAQFLIATHSPILMSYPGAIIYNMDGDGMREIAYLDTDHYQLTRDFLNAPERYLELLFGEDDRDEGGHGT